MPAAAVSVEPTFAVPLIVGAGAVVNAPSATVAVAVDVFEVVRYPDLVPVTRTVSVAPAAAAPGG